MSHFVLQNIIKYK